MIFSSFFGIAGLTSFKRLCRQLGIRFWPYQPRRRVCGEAADQNPSEEGVAERTQDCNVKPPTSTDQSESFQCPANLLPVLGPNAPRNTPPPADCSQLEPFSSPASPTPDTSVRAATTKTESAITKAAEDPGVGSKAAAAVSLKLLQIMQFSQE
jgi:hypothetical protein